MGDDPAQYKNTKIVIIHGLRCPRQPQPLRFRSMLTVYDASCRRNLNYNQQYFGLFPSSPFLMWGVGKRPFREPLWRRIKFAGLVRTGTLFFFFVLGHTVHTPPLIVHKPSTQKLAKGWFPGVPVLRRSRPRTLNGEEEEIAQPEIDGVGLASLPVKYVCMYKRTIEGRRPCGT